MGIKPAEPTNNDDEGTDDDITASNKLLKPAGVDLDIGTKADKTSTGEGEYQITEENKILDKILIAFLHLVSRLASFA